MFNVNILFNEVVLKYKIKKEGNFTDLMKIRIKQQRRDNSHLTRGLAETIYSKCFIDKGLSLNNN